MTDPVLEVRKLNKSFGALAATSNVDITLLAGEIHALIGPNGAGKSTLIKQLSGNLKPDSGHVLFEGHDITHEDTVRRARRGLGRSFQISSVIPEHTVLQNVVLAIHGNRRSSFRLFRNALSDKQVTEGASTQIARVGLEGREAVRVSDLSHGERRKLEIAMALAMHPKCFLLDEPMAGMGAEGTAEMTTLLQELKKEAPILLVEHDMDAVFALADRISVLDYGRIIATGSVDEVRNDAEVRRAYLGDDE